MPTPAINQQPGIGSPFVTKGVTLMGAQTSDNVNITGGCIDVPNIFVSSQLGIGTNSPTSTLHVVGTTNLVSLLGTAAAGTTISNNTQTSFSGDSGGTSDVRNLLASMTAQGTQAIDSVNGLNQHIEIQTTAGNTTNAFATRSYIRLGLAEAGPTGSPIITGGTITNALVFDGHVANEGNANITGITAAFNAAGVDLNNGGTGTIARVYGFRSKDQGHATRVTNTAAGFIAEDQTAGAPVTAGFLSDVTSGTNKFGFYARDTAINAFMGNTGLGHIAPDTALVVRKDVAGAESVVALFTNSSATATGKSTTINLGFGNASTGAGVRAAQISALTTDGSTSALIFRTANGSTPLEAARITPERFFGINTTTPDVQLGLGVGSTFSLQNSRNSSTDYERLDLYWSGNIARIEAAKGSGGGSYRDIEIRTAALPAFHLDTSQVPTFYSASPAFKFGVTLTDGAAAQTATLTNAPAAGNPTKWFAINDNGTTRYIPAW